MKKFGTPIGAGPGSEKEKVGLAGVGTPPGPTRGRGFDGFFGGVLVFGLAGEVPVAPLWVDGWLVPGPFALGGDEAEGVVEGWVEVDPECFECGAGVERGPVLVVELVVVVLLDVEVVDVLDVVEVELDVVTGVEVVVEVGLVTCGQDSVIDLTPGGRLSDETGLPGGSWK
jgi:hypothetical protein